MPQNVRKSLITFLIAAAVITLLSEIAAALIITRLAGLTAPLDASGELYPRLIQLKEAELSPDPLFPALFAVVAAAAASAGKTGKGVRIASAAVVCVCVFGALFSAVWCMSVNGVPFGKFISILAGYIRGGLLDAL